MAAGARFFTPYDGMARSALERSGLGGHGVVDSVQLCNALGFRVFRRMPSGYASPCVTVGDEIGQAAVNERAAFELASALYPHLGRDERTLTADAIVLPFSDFATSIGEAGWDVRMLHGHWPLCPMPQLARRIAAIAGGVSSLFSDGSVVERWRGARRETLPTVSEFRLARAAHARMETLRLGERSWAFALGDGRLLTLFGASELAQAERVGATISPSALGRASQGTGQHFVPVCLGDGPAGRHAHRGGAA